MVLWYAVITKNGFFDSLGKEDILQASVAEYIRQKYPDVLFHHSPNEGKRGMFAQWKIKLFGVRSMPDVMIYKPRFKEDGKIRYCGCAIELKVKPNVLTSNQETVLQELEQVGWQQHVCYDFSGAVGVIDNYLNGKK